MGNNFKRMLYFLLREKNRKGQTLPRLLPRHYFLRQPLQLFLCFQQKQRRHFLLLLLLPNPVNIHYQNLLLLRLLPHPLRI